MARNLLIQSFKGLHNKQKLFPWAYIDNNGNIKETCRQMKMNPTTFQKWLENPEFKAYHDFVIDLNTESLKGLAFSALKKALEDGNVQAIRTYYEMQGKIKSHKTSIDARNVEYKISFGKGSGTDNRLRGPFSPEDGASGHPQISDSSSG